MKTNGTRTLFIVIILQLALLIICMSAKAQPDYYFNTPTLISGTDKQVGAVYRFTNVKPGVDAEVTISAISPGITVVDFDAGSGYVEALQPTLNVAAGVKGYLEMKFLFLQGGTNITMVQTEVPATCIDVDGGNNVNEYDELDLGPGSYVDYNMVGFQLTIASSSNWFIGTNIGDIEYPGRDTSAKEVMFTVVNANISTATIRVGAHNSGSSAQQRLRSVYFKKFIYANAFLAKSSLLSFRGYERNKQVELLVNLISDHKLAKIVVERGSAAGNFKAIGEIEINNVGQTSYKYADQPFAENNNAYYRLKLISVSGSVEYSNVLAFRSGTDQQKGFAIYPSVVQSGATINLNAKRTGYADMKIADMSGRVVMSRQLAVQEGNNNITLAGLDRLVSGNYVVVVSHDQNLFSQKIIKR